MGKATSFIEAVRSGLYGVIIIIARMQIRRSPLNKRETSILAPTRKILTTDRRALPSGDVRGVMAREGGGTEEEEAAEDEEEGYSFSKVVVVGGVRGISWDSVLGLVHCATQPLNVSATLM